MTNHCTHEQSQEEKKQHAIQFITWVDDGAWIRDPFHRKEFNDDQLRYSNIATIDIHSDDKLQVFTIEELYDKFIATMVCPHYLIKQPDLPAQYCILCNTVFNLTSAE